MIEVSGSQLIQVMTSLARMQEIIGHHGITSNAAESDSILPKHDLIVFDVLVDLGNSGVFQDRFQSSQSFITIKLFVLGRASNGKIPALAFLPRESQTNDFRPARRHAGRFQINRDASLITQLLDK